MVSGRPVAGLTPSTPIRRIPESTSTLPRRCASARRYSHAHGSSALTFAAQSARTRRWDGAARSVGKSAPKKTNPQAFDLGVWCNLPDDDLLSRARCSLSSALKRFTVLFGMGRSGSTSLWSSGMTCRQQEGPASQSGKRSYRFQLLDRIAHFARGCDRTTQSSSADFLQSYRVKPHGQLVLVSLTCHHASTPSLSTSWSRTTLQGDLVPREISS